MILRVAFTQRPIGRVFFVLFLGAFAHLASGLQNDETAVHALSYEPSNQNVLRPPQTPSSTGAPTHDAPSSITTSITTSSTINALQQLHSALSVLQIQYFSLWLGKWTSAIDWTAAVMGTHMSGTLSSLSHSLSYTLPGTFDKTHKLDVEAQMVENEINRYFAQSVTYFFGEDYFSLRTQANDDMLWVVLGWLESIKFINSHSARHYASSSHTLDSKVTEWHGNQFIPVFAHRARVFYELASKGWDWELCGGGMTWDPHLLPYKNAITNQLFISASIGMYLHFPGDDNCSPFMGVNASSKSTYDPIYLAAAINGYKWLKGSGMMNTQGLYVDGFHIRGYAQNHSKTECDERNEMVYTYNQGVVLSGLRGLWEATGNVEYLEDGHQLARNVIKATGWTDTDITTTVSFNSPKPEAESKAISRNKNKQQRTTSSWSGLGTAGILTEACDPSGYCSQNGHTFKGIFFHHLLSFCVPLPSYPVRPGRTHGADKFTAKLHRSSCAAYTKWVVHNAQAAARTRDEEGRFGGWWGAGIEHDQGEKMKQKGESKAAKRNVDSLPLLAEGAIDYRNNASLLSFAPFSSPSLNHPVSRDIPISPILENTNGEIKAGDLNDRGRGRTVETQGSGVAVVRAMWEFLRLAEGRGEGGQV
ncbi:glycoside hydrolase family 76 protein [Pleomassaria siparia CBS 279.74]|uniref:Glycoside hydrolase family 76 protein n=1 Tax=Pleomassaria siparia CBS 279.74 TaxID=1314801 RepID=A0A6G1KHH9_9PLEO|nr:glycoside hydrolase family 76 protein [Pleomassaria siparia CBS 279.74]